MVVVELPAFHEQERDVGAALGDSHGEFESLFRIGIDEGHVVSGRGRGVARRVDGRRNYFRLDAEPFPVGASGEARIGDIARAIQIARIAGEFVELDVPEIDDHRHALGQQRLSYRHGVVALDHRDVGP
jgi:hypothetical protein